MIQTLINTFINPKQLSLPQNWFSTLSRKFVWALHSMFFIHIAKLYSQCLHLKCRLPILTTLLLLCHFIVSKRCLSSSPYSLFSFWSEAVLYFSLKNKLQANRSNRPILYGLHQNVPKVLNALLTCCSVFILSLIPKETIILMKEHTVKYSRDK